MLGLARGVAFGMDVGDFLEFESAIHRDGIVNGASQEKKVIDLVKLRSNFLYLVRATQERLQLRGKLQQLANVLLAQVGTQGLARLREVQGKQEQGSHLRGKSLGRGDADLRPRQRVNDAI